MTRVDVVGTGYADGSALLHDGNLWAARAVSRLVDGLGGTGGMAGDSAFADSWAREYDETGAALCVALADAVSALGNLGRLAFASLENHTRAERASTFGGERLVGDAPMGADDWVEVLPLRPPASLGSDPSSLPGWATTILDHVEGFVWPDADLDRLHGAARTWRAAADALDDVATYPRRAIYALWTESSPDVLPATAAIGRLAASVDDLAAACREVAATCEGYAEQVQTQRDAILDLVRDLLRDAVIIQAAGFLLGFVSLGAANGGALAINATKLAAAAPRFAKMVSAVRIYADAAAHALLGTRLAVAGVGTRLRPMADPRLLMTAEVGQVGSKARKASSFLRRHEGGPMKAHTIDRHVGKSDDFLRHRLRKDRRLNLVSTFPDEATAERSIRTVLELRQKKLESFMAGSKQRTMFQAPVDNAGRVMMRNGDIVEGTTVRMLLAKDASMPEGYRIITSFVTP